MKGSRMKRLLAAVIAIVLIWNQFPVVSFAENGTDRELSFAGDNGPHAISSKEELDAIRTNLKGEYYLTANIVFTAADFEAGGAFYNEGAKWIPIGTSSAPFTGKFDGKGYTISGLEVYINRSSASYGGLFGYVRSSSSNNGIYNLGMLDGYVFVSNAIGDGYAGSVAGYCEIGRIEGCYHTGYVAATASSGTAYSGGVVGYKEYGEITRCYNTGTVVGGGTVGGIVGGADFASVSNCYNTAEMNGNYAGGIAGSCSFGTVSTCYSLGDHSSFYGPGFAGGIVGMNTNCSVTNSYYTSSTTSGGGTKRPISAMQDQSAFSGFDFAVIWTMGSGVYSYPELRGVGTQYTRTLERITVSTLPQKTEYWSDEEMLDVTGGEITLIYSDGSTSTVGMTNEMVSGFDPSVPGEQTITVSYAEKTTSFTVSVKMKAPAAPQTPKVDVSNVTSSGKIKLTWTAVDGAVKYEVYRSASQNGTYTRLSTTTGTQLTNTSATAGDTYFYYVKAVSEAGVKSEPSNIVSCTCDLARPTLTVTNVASSGKPQIRWNAVTGATKYTLYIYDANGALLKSTTTTGTALTHSSATVGTAYTYKVRALCSVSAAASAYSSAKSITCGLARPTLTVTNVASSGKPQIRWNAVTGATKYTLYIYDANGALLKSTTTTGTALTHSSAMVGTAYTYKVKALCNVSAAASAYSSAKSITCDLARPTLTVTNVASSGKPQIRWNAVSGATKYTLYIYDANGTLLKTASTAGTSLTHSSAVAGSAYTYKVKAMCGVNAATSDYSAAKSCTCDLARPTLAVTLNSKGKPVLTWGKVSGAVKYTVYIYDADGALVKTGSTTGTKLTHSTAVAGNAYKYCVIAVSEVNGADSVMSAAVSIRAE